MEYLGAFPCISIRCPASDGNEQTLPVALPGPAALAGRAEREALRSCQEACLPRQWPAALGEQPRPSPGPAAASGDALDVPGAEAAPAQARTEPRPLGGSPGPALGPPPRPFGMSCKTQRRPGCPYTSRGGWSPGFGEKWGPASRGDRARHPRCKLRPRHPPGQHLPSPSFLFKPASSLSHSSDGPSELYWVEVPCHLFPAGSPPPSRSALPPSLPSSFAPCPPRFSLHGVLQWMEAGKWKVPWSIIGFRPYLWTCRSNNSYLLCRNVYFALGIFPYNRRTNVGKISTNKLMHEKYGFSERWSFFCLIFPGAFLPPDINSNQRKG